MVGHICTQRSIKVNIFRETLSQEINLTRALSKFLGTLFGIEPFRRGPVLHPSPYVPLSITGTDVSHTALENYAFVTKILFIRRIYIVYGLLNFDNREI